MEARGRYVAHYDENKRQWEVRIIDEKGAFAVPAEGPLPCTSYTDCVRTIRRLEGNSHAQVGRKR